ALTCLVPLRAEEGAYVWELIGTAREPLLVAWLVVGSLAGIVAMFLGFAGLRGRWRHFLNFLMGVVTLALPLFAPVILPLSGLGTVGWVMLMGIVALYAGAGIRIVRPSQIVGQAMGGLGAFLIAVFAFLPMEGGEHDAFAVERIRLAVANPGSWRDMIPFLLLSLAVLCGMLNLVRSRYEVLLAKITRLLLVAALLFWIMLPFLEAGSRLAPHLPVAWGAVRFVAPLFLSLDGCIAFVAISITRSND
ncbi:MAG: hypothetical protein ACYSUN_15710, partial [Planctomycetota bacterium]